MKQIVEAHGGALRVSSREPVAGTTMMIWLPTPEADGPVPESLPVVGKPS